MNEDKVLQMFFDIGRWTKVIEKGVLKDIRKNQFIRLTDEHIRMTMTYAMRRGRYEISPPHTAQILKDNGEFRTVYVNEPMDRVVLDIASDLLFELMPEMLRSLYESYQTGIGCGRVVTEVSHRMIETGNSGCLGWKSDLSKYFDSVPIRFVDEAFDKVEVKHGQFALIDVLRKYYHSNLYLNEDNRLQSKYRFLKQGRAVTSWLADVLLYGLDRELSQMNGYYVRYSDNMLFIGKGYEKATDTLQKRLEDKSMKLNPKKVEYLAANVWFKFLGFSIRGGMVSLSSSCIKTFQHEIEQRTIRCRDTTLAKTVDVVNRHLYKGESSWAIQILPACNVKSGLSELDKFAMDCFKAIQTGRCKTGGLGYVRTKPDGCVVRGRGRNMEASRDKTDRDIPGYLIAGYMRNAPLTSRTMYNTLVTLLQATPGTRQNGRMGRLFNVTGL